MTHWGRTSQKTEDPWGTKRWPPKYQSILGVKFHSVYQLSKWDHYKFLQLTFCHCQVSTSCQVLDLCNYRPLSTSRLHAEPLSFRILARVGWQIQDGATLTFTVSAFCLVTRTLSITMYIYTRADKMRIISSAVLVYSIGFVQLIHGSSTAERIAGKSTNTPNWFSRVHYNELGSSRFTPSRT